MKNSFELSSNFTSSGVFVNESHASLPLSDIAAVFSKNRFIKINVDRGETLHSIAIKGFDDICELVSDAYQQMPEIFSEDPGSEFIPAVQGIVDEIKKGEDRHTMHIRLPRNALQSLANTDSVIKTAYDFYVQTKWQETGIPDCHFAEGDIVFDFSQTPSHQKAERLALTINKLGSFFDKWKNSLGINTRSDVISGENRFDRPAL